MADEIRSSSNAQTRTPKSLKLYTSPVTKSLKSKKTPIENKPVFIPKWSPSPKVTVSTPVLKGKLQTQVNVPRSSAHLNTHRHLARELPPAKVKVPRSSALLNTHKHLVCDQLPPTEVKVPRSSALLNTHRHLVRELPPSERHRLLTMSTPDEGFTPPKPAVKANKEDNGDSKTKRDMKAKSETAQQKPSISDIVPLRLPEDNFDDIRLPKNTIPKRLFPQLENKPEEKSQYLDEFSLPKNFMPPKLKQGPSCSHVADEMNFIEEVNLPKNDIPKKQTDGEGSRIDKDGPHSKPSNKTQTLQPPIQQHKHKLMPAKNDDVKSVTGFIKNSPDTLHSVSQVKSDSIVTKGDESNKSQSNEECFNPAETNAEKETENTAKSTPKALNQEESSQEIDLQSQILLEETHKNIDHTDCLHVHDDSKGDLNYQPSNSEPLVNMPDTPVTDQLIPQSSTGAARKQKSSLQSTLELRQHLVKEILGEQLKQELLEQAEVDRKPPTADLVETHVDDKTCPSRDITTGVEAQKEEVSVIAPKKPSDQVNESSISQNAVRELPDVEMLSSEVSPCKHIAQLEEIKPTIVTLPDLVGVELTKPSSKKKSDNDMKHPTVANKESAKGHSKHVLKQMSGKETKPTVGSKPEGAQVQSKLNPKQESDKNAKKPVTAGKPYRLPAMKTKPPEKSYHFDDILRPRQSIKLPMTAREPKHNPDILEKVVTYKNAHKVNRLIPLARRSTDVDFRPGLMYRTVGLSVRERPRTNTKQVAAENTVPAAKVKEPQLSTSNKQLDESAKSGCKLTTQQPIAITDSEVSSKPMTVVDEPTSNKQEKLIPLADTSIDTESNIESRVPIIAVETEESIGEIKHVKVEEPRGTAKLTALEMSKKPGILGTEKKTYAPEIVGVPEVIALLPTNQVPSLVSKYDVLANQLHISDTPQHKTDVTDHVDEPLKQKIDTICVDAKEQTKNLAAKIPETQSAETLKQTRANDIVDASRMKDLTSKISNTSFTESLTKKQALAERVEPMKNADVSSKNSHAQMSEVLKKEMIIESSAKIVEDLMPKTSNAKMSEVSKEKPAIESFAASSKFVENLINTKISKEKPAVESLDVSSKFVENLINTKISEVSKEKPVVESFAKIVEPISGMLSQKSNIKMSEVLEEKPVVESFAVSSKIIEDLTSQKSNSKMSQELEEKPAVKTFVEPAQRKTSLNPKMSNTQVSEDIKLNLDVDMSADEVTEETKNFASKIFELRNTQVSEASKEKPVVESFVESSKFVADLINTKMSEVSKEKPFIESFATSSKTVEDIMAKPLSAKLSEVAKEKPSVESFTVSSKIVEGITAKPLSAKPSEVAIEKPIVESFTVSSKIVEGITAKPLSAKPSEVAIEKPIVESFTVSSKIVEGITAKPLSAKPSEVAKEKPIVESFAVSSKIGEDLTFITTNSKMTDVLKEKPAVKEFVELEQKKNMFNPEMPLFQVSEKIKLDLDVDMSTAEGKKFASKILEILNDQVSEASQEKPAVESFAASSKIVEDVTSKTSRAKISEVLEEKPYVEEFVELAQEKKSFNPKMSNTQVSEEIKLNLVSDEVTEETKNFASKIFEYMNSQVSEAFNQIPSKDIGDSKISHNVTPKIPKLHISEETNQKPAGKKSKIPKLKEPKKLNKQMTHSNTRTTQPISYSTEFYPTLTDSLDSSNEPRAESMWGEILTPQCFTSHDPPISKGDVETTETNEPNNITSSKKIIKSEELKKQDIIMLSPRSSSRNNIKGAKSVSSGGKVLPSGGGSHSAGSAGGASDGGRGNTSNTRTAQPISYSTEFYPTLTDSLDSSNEPRAESIWGEILTPQCFTSHDPPISKVDLETTETNEPINITNSKKIIKSEELKKQDVIKLSPRSSSRNNIKGAKSVSSGGKVLPSGGGSRSAGSAGGASDGGRGGSRKPPDIEDLDAKPKTDSKPMLTVQIPTLDFPNHAVQATIRVEIVSQDDNNLHRDGESTTVRALDKGTEQQSAAAFPRGGSEKPSHQDSSVNARKLETVGVSSTLKGSIPPTPLVQKQDEKVEVSISPLVPKQDVKAESIVLRFADANAAQLKPGKSIKEGENRNIASTVKEQEAMKAQLKKEPSNQIVKEKIHDYVSPPQIVLMSELHKQDEERQKIPKTSISKNNVPVTGAKKKATTTHLVSSKPTSLRKSEDKTKLVGGIKKTNKPVLSKSENKLPSSGTNIKPLLSKSEHKIPLPADEKKLESHKVTPKIEKASEGKDLKGTLPLKEQEKSVDKKDNIAVAKTAKKTGEAPDKTNKLMDRVGGLKVEEDLEAKDIKVEKLADQENQVANKKDDESKKLLIKEESRVKSAAQKESLQLKEQNKANTVKITLKKSIPQENIPNKTQQKTIENNEGKLNQVHKDLEVKPNINKDVSKPKLEVKGKFGKVLKLRSSKPKVGVKQVLIPLKEDGRRPTTRITDLEQPTEIQWTKQTSSTTSKPNETAAKPFEFVPEPAKLLTMLEPPSQIKPSTVLEHSTQAEAEKRLKPVSNEKKISVKAQVLERGVSNFLDPAPRLTRPTHLMKSPIVTPRKLADTQARPAVPSKPPPPDVPGAGSGQAPGDRPPGKPLEPSPLEEVEDWTRKGEPPLTGLSKHFNSSTIKGRANVAKATFALLGIYTLYRLVRPKK